ncbi:MULTISPECIES: SdiA-regulated domain-containing protein [Dyadobacter]|uniref:SdiA-regulated domain-containing protein n=1 Tax=Dyadobacter chenhuakuii TaxID=2909339 RepID=A0A9X1TVY9_9BACT|nr:MULTISPECIES: SdiA-regulated domain-containing protein [Dyadobacter]MCF2493917.1 SdiA-regulated domain-containing protein [Dyadobacter chenhuakuii]MCF2500572.1 SdiA-regulated domain-containing protein [Dyadobacter chenhuakuii]MCF2518165.1 SdiA-regulated domain-containing protein [Dyadobacter sp. CY351]USJ31048.1 SdiA-regulated domain-containing protein [Dyadobacter chenhuakuii]
MATFLQHIGMLALLTLGGCDSTKKEQVVYKDYDLGKPDKFNMPESLFEISGITLNQGNPDTIYAIQDEDGRLYRLGWDEPKQLNAKFSKKGDYEDVTIIRNNVYVLKSNGAIYNFPLTEAVFEEVEQIREMKKILPKGEYEGMFGDEASGKIYILCKNCEQDNSKSSVTGYILEPDKDSAKISETFSIQVDEIKAITGKVERGFRPSGLAKNPVTNDWYIISAVNKLLVVTDNQWKVKEAYALNGNQFIQPEGIIFDKQGNLYISNEGDDLFSGNILKFKKKNR